MVKRLRLNSPKDLGYVVVGYATSVQGLKAPFDEENTKEVLKIEYIKDPDEIISFWMNSVNTNQYDEKIIDKAIFDKLTS